MAGVDNAAYHRTPFMRAASIIAKTLRCSRLGPALALCPAAACLVGGQSCAQVPVSIWQVPLQGDTYVHDPSSIQKDSNRYYLAATGRGLRTLSSPDGTTWSGGNPIFEAPPTWALEAIPGFRGHIWAPDLIRVNDRYHLYYSVSRFGKQTSAIGLATNPTLDPQSPRYLWTDRGPVIQSDESSPFNAIDPSCLLDESGRLWMAFGSFWRGIFLVELDRATGLRVAPDSPTHRLAWHQSIEAPCLMRQDGYYFLFVNWGLCCRGTNSTYEIRVGRSRVITGPYLDHEGTDMVDGGGKLVLETHGRFIGPGHLALLSPSENNLFSYHFYDRDDRGRSHLALGKLNWTEDGWPDARTLAK